MNDHDDDAVIDRDPLDTEEGGILEGDQPEGWSKLADTLEETGNRPAGPDFGASPLDDETPGSQGEIESGSEGDFGGVPAPADDDRV